MVTEGPAAPVEEVRLGTESTVEDRDAAGRLEKRFLKERRLRDEAGLAGEAAAAWLPLDLLPKRPGEDVAEAGLEP